MADQPWRLIRAGLDDEANAHRIRFSHRQGAHIPKFGECTPAGAGLYGLWACRDTSVRRLEGIGQRPTAGASMLLMWADRSVSRHRSTPHNPGVAIDRAVLRPDRGRRACSHQPERRPGLAQCPRRRRQGGGTRATDYPSNSTSARRSTAWCPRSLQSGAVVAFAFIAAPNDKAGPPCTGSEHAPTHMSAPLRGSRSWR